MGVLGAIVIAVSLFMHFGGFSTGKNLDPEEFAKYAKAVEEIEVPDNAEIIALGEATHGNIEFQELKLSVFKQMVEEYGVRAFVLEGDYGGCEQVNRYIHGGDGTVEDAAEAIGFAIYRTDEIAKLISYMRQYNSSAAEGEDLRFYGFDMQRYMYSFRFLLESCNKLGIDTENIEVLMSGEDWNDDYSNSVRKEKIALLRTELEGKENSELAIHCADMLLQYCEIQIAISTNVSGASDLRDQYMAENVEWVLSQEQRRGCKRIFISGHNSHVAKWGSYDSMGKILSDELGDAYYAIGTDLYKTQCNLPTRSGQRTNQVFYSHDPLAKTAKMAGLDNCWLDFNNIPQNTELSDIVSEYTYIGNLGETYSFIMRLLPPSYRIFQPPATLFDSMIFVVNATPIKMSTR